MNLLSISVITPSYNQAKFLTECLDSVAKQTLAPLEHILLDPGSSDESRQIAEEFGGLDLIFEPDEGQSDAINKGFLKAKGDVLCWLNSDDFYPDSKVFETVINIFNANPDCSVVYGNANFVGEQREFIRKGYVNPDSENLLASFEHQVGIIQPSVFIKREVFETVGGPPLDMDFTIDYEYWVRIAKAGFKWAFTDAVLSHHRWWSEMKTASRRGDSYLEHLDTCLKHFGYANYKWISRYSEYLLSGADGIVNCVDSSTGDSKQDLLSLERNLHKAYNLKLDVFNKMHSSAATVGMKDTLLRMSEIGINESLPIKSIDPNMVETAQGVRERDDSRPLSWKRLVTDNGFAYAAGDEFSLEFDRNWFNYQKKKSDDCLGYLTKSRSQDTCIIVGNGPSLNKIDFQLLKGQDVFISNFAYYNESLKDSATYFTVTNRLVADQGYHEINQLTGPVKIFPFYLNQYIHESKNTIFLDALLRNEFSKNAADWISWRSTVSFFNLQLAYTLGYKKVILIGFDHSYVQDKNLVEGDIIDQKDDDKNHFDPRYFKGKKWQAADVDNMEATYHLAKKVFGESGREIVNCTVGGHLDIFRRNSLEMELFRRKDLSVGLAQPKILVISSSAISSKCATGALKTKLFDGIQKSNLMQIYTDPGPTQQAAQFIKIDQGSKYKHVLQKVTKFNPDVIYFRINEGPECLNNIAYPLLKDLNIPIVTHIMDDWMTRMEKNNKNYFDIIHPQLIGIVKSAKVNLSICDKMSHELEKRYGREFTPIANFLTNSHKVLRGFANKKFTIRYCGALAEDMTLQSLKDFADVVTKLSSNGLDLVFEIYTMPWFKKAAEQIATSNAVKVFDLVDEKNYEKLLVTADLLLIAYNFDEVTIDYTRYSMANKLPECINSGTPLLVYGPEDVATVSYCNEMELATVINKRSVDRLLDTLSSIMKDNRHFLQIAESAQGYFAEKHSKDQVYTKFHVLLRNAISTETIQNDMNMHPAFSETEYDRGLVMNNSSILVGPLSRQDKIHFDETNLISEYVGQKEKGFMIDVGAHHGYASSPFLDKGWGVIGYEPDPNNRKILQQRLGDHPRLKIIQDAVSDVAGETVSFYASDESTGVSGLSGFTEKHKIICEVKTTTLTDQIRENNISTIDFLKIDTEGFDLMVLKGFPWKTHRPNIIECEFENAKTVPLGYVFEDIANYLVGHGYNVYVSEWHPIIRYGIQHDWRSLSRYPCTLATDAAWGNLLAFNSTVDESMLIRKLKGLANLDDSLASVNPIENKCPEEVVAIPTLSNRINIRLSAMLMPYPKLHTIALNISTKIKSIRRIGE